MPSPRNPNRLRITLFLLALLPAAYAAGPRPNDPDILIPLDALNFVPPSARLLASGGTLFTLNFVDNTHLLFTFFNRNLITRLPDGEPDDYDGNVTAELLELPTGKILAQTEWRVRDHDPYLWPLGHGRFLRRVRSRLTVFDPLGNLPHGEPFKEEPFGDSKRRIGYIATSPNGDLIAIETLPPKILADQTITNDAPAPHRGDVEIAFYRLALEQEKNGSERLVRHPAGTLATTHLIGLPANADGFLSAAQDGPGVYNFDYHSHAGGPVKELAAFDTTCNPHTQFLSRSDFIAFGCNGNAGKQMIGAFNLKGENPWVEVIGGNDLGSTIVSSPVAGRFVMSRVLISSTVTDIRTATPEEFQGQEVVVRQTYDGRTILKTTAAPIQRSAQNVDLSPDGLSLATIRNGSVAVFHLALLTPKDNAALKLAQSMEPPANDARIRLNSVSVQADNPEVPAQPSPEPAPAQAGTQAQSSVPVSPPTNAVAKPEPTEETIGDVPTPRTAPPSLYTPDHPRQPGDPAPTKPKPE